MKSLVVDDDYRNIFAITALLERTSDIDIVLVDIMMPIMDGYATMRAMREPPTGEHLPILAFTAKINDGERQRCIDAGASAHVPKPVETDDLLCVLSEWLPAAAPQGDRETRHLDDRPGRPTRSARSAGRGDPRR